MASYVISTSDTSKLEKKKFIMEVQKRRALWDKRLSKHKDRQLVRCLWTEVADVMNWDVEICKKTWKNLFDQFRHNYNQAVRSKARSDGIEDIEASIASVKWAFFNQLMFLRELIAKRRMLSCLLMYSGHTRHFTNYMDIVYSGHTRHFTNYMDIVNRSAQRSMHAWTDCTIFQLSDFGRATEQKRNIICIQSEDAKSTITNTRVSTETLVYEECLSYPDGSEGSSSPMPLGQEALEAPPVIEAPLCRPSIRSLAPIATTNASTDTTNTEPSVSGITSRPQKRQRTADSTDETFHSFAEQLNSMDHMVNSMDHMVHSSVRPDSASIFGAYVTDLLRDVPADSRRRCELSVLQLMHSYLH